MRLGIMQPYFFPYVGYYQLMNSTDEFVLWDCIKYTKRGWVNRNRILVCGKERVITVPIKKDSDCKNISDRRVADSWKKDREHLLRTIRSAYSDSIGFREVYPVIRECVEFEEKNLFHFLSHSIHATAKLLGVKTKITAASCLQINHSLKGEQKVISVCKLTGATTYVNAIGGVRLYTASKFAEEGIDLVFSVPHMQHYPQPAGEFVKGLSIIDVMMRAGIEKTREMVKVCNLL